MDIVVMSRVMPFKHGEQGWTWDVRIEALHLMQYFKSSSREIYISRDAAIMGMRQQVIESVASMRNSIMGLHNRFIDGVTRKEYQSIDEVLQAQNPSSINMESLIVQAGNMLIAEDFKNKESWLAESEKVLPPRR